MHVTVMPLALTGSDAIAPFQFQAARPRAANAGASSLVLNKIQPDQARAFLARRIGEQLGRLEAPAMPAATLGNDPEATAKRVMAMAQALLQNSRASRGQIDRAIDQGLERHEKSSAVLSEAAQSLRRDFAQALDTTERQAPASELTEASYQQYRSQTQLSIQLETRDGDVITIELQRQRQQSLSLASYQDEKLDLEAASMTTSEQTRLDINIQGQLDEDEREAIDEFLRKVEKLADRFQQGSLENVMKQAAKLRPDDEQLRAFSLNLRSVEEYRSVEAYQQSSGPATTANVISSLPVVQSELKALLSRLMDTVMPRQPERFAHDALQATLMLKGPPDQEERWPGPLLA